MKTILVRFYSVDEVFGDTKNLTEEEIKNMCFRANKYNTPFEALDAYANTMVTWSVLKDEDDDIHAFINEAYEHIKNNDYDWLEKNFT